MTTEHPLLKKKAFVFDMDGTIYLEDTPIDGAIDALALLRKRGCRIMYFTNNSSKMKNDYVEKLNRLGFTADRNDIMTSGDVTVSYLLAHHPNQTVYLLGTPALVKGFTLAGIKMDDKNPDVVVIGFDTTLTYEKIDNACHFIRNGAAFIATHPDVNCPAKKGFLPDCGAMCAMIEASTDKKPKVLGKPHVETIQAILEHAGIQKQDLAVVGDRLATDIALGTLHGVTSVLVMTGATDSAALDHSKIKPDFTFPSVVELARLFEEGEGT